MEKLSRDELLNEELALDAWADAKYDALEDEKEEAVLCGYCKVPMDGEELYVVLVSMKSLEQHRLMERVAPLPLKRGTKQVVVRTLRGRMNNRVW